MTIRSTKWIAEGTREIILAPVAEPGREDMISPLPGQFAHISVPGVFLRRPISIAGYNHENHLLRLIVRRAGRGTEILSKLPAGSGLRALLPLGNPFPMGEISGIARRGGRVWIVSGGIGIAPMLFLAEYAVKSGIHLDSFAGFIDEDSVFGISDLEACGECALSVGGFVTDSISSALRERRPELIAACGPMPMLASLQKICAEGALSAYASFEARMGCGIGACLVCNRGFEASGEFAYRRVCLDGPVFNLLEAKFS
jgi:dihydroorotate dehydrogenase electron transfer subunit